MTIIGDAAHEHERLQIVIFLRGRAALVREAAAKVPGHLSMGAEIAAATLEANALLIEGGEHEKRTTRAPTAHPPEPEPERGRATWEVWQESLGRSSEGWGKVLPEDQRRWRAIALAEQGAGAFTVHPPASEPERGRTMWEELGQSSAGLRRYLARRRRWRAIAFAEGGIPGKGHVDLRRAALPSAPSGTVRGKKQDEREREHDWLESERSQINEDD